MQHKQTLPRLITAFIFSLAITMPLKADWMECPPIMWNAKGDLTHVLVAAFYDYDDGGNIKSATCIYNYVGNDPEVR